jgi:hypothetical protein
MTRNLACIVTIGVLVLVSGAMAQDLNKEQAAVMVAKKWLNMVDQGTYGASWKEASRYFKNAVTQEQWQQALQAARSPLGALVYRKVKNKNYMTSLPGAPDGEYVVIQFDTSFENKKSAVETVTPMIDEDGSWRVSGYYIN